MAIYHRLDSFLKPLTLWLPNPDSIGAFHSNFDFPAIGATGFPFCPAFPIIQFSLLHKLPVTFSRFAGPAKILGVPFPSPSVFFFSFSSSCCISIRRLLLSCPPHFRRPPSFPAHLVCGPFAVVFFFLSLSFPLLVLPHHRFGR